VHGFLILRVITYSALLKGSREAIRKQKEEGMGDASRYCPGRKRHPKAKGGGRNVIFPE